MCTFSVAMSHEHTLIFVISLPLSLAYTRTLTHSWHCQRLILSTEGCECTRTSLFLLFHHLFSRFVCMCSDWFGFSSQNLVDCTFCTVFFSFCFFVFLFVLSQFRVAVSVTDSLLSVCVFFFSFFFFLFFAYRAQQFSEHTITEWCEFVTYYQKLFCLGQNPQPFFSLACIESMYADMFGKRADFDRAAAVDRAFWVCLYRLLKKLPSSVRKQPFVLTIFICCWFLYIFFHLG